MYKGEIIVKRKIIFDPAQNPAKNFMFIERDIKKVAETNGVSIVEVIDEFIVDLQNFNNPNHEKNVEEVELNGAVSDGLLKSLISYLNKVKKGYLQKENKDKQKQETQGMELKWKEIEALIDKFVLSGEQGTEIEIIEELILAINNGEIDYKFNSKEQKYFIKKLKDRLNKANEREAEKEKQIIDNKINAEKAMEQIREIVEREYEAGNIKNKASYMSTIRDMITGKNEDGEIDIKIEEPSKELLLELLDQSIKTEKDELYYDQVRKFTNDFQFLKQYSEVIKATKGSTKRSKFTDKDSYDRFCSLRERLQKKCDEYTGIESLVNSSNIDEVDRRILIERKQVMDREIEEKRKNGEIR